MNEKQIIVGLDVGTTKVCAIVGCKPKNSTSENQLEIIGVGSHPSYGLKKGSVVNIDKTVKSIRCAIEEAKLMAGVNFTKATIGIAGNHIYNFNSSGVVPIKGHEITQEDVDRVIEAAKAVIIPLDREILHVIPQEFRVDNIGGIKDPVGMRGVRLEAHVHIVTGATSLIQNMIKCVEQAGVIADNIMLQPIASSNAVLGLEEKELGVALVDIGGGTTDVAIWKDGSLVQSLIIPVGGNHFTNDLAVALKIPHAEAERIKINHGCVLAEKINQSTHITVQGLSGTRPTEVGLGVVAQILGARAEELFDTIREFLQEKGIENEITGGLVLTGGGALIKGLPELAEHILERPAKIGHPIPFGGMTNIMQNPKFSTVLGLLLEANRNTSPDASNIVSNDYFSSHDYNEYESTYPQQRMPSIPPHQINKHNKDLIGKLTDSLKNVFREIF